MSSTLSTTANNTSSTFAAAIANGTTSIANGAVHEIELRFPSSIYYADPYAAIRSVLGNDIEILDYKESNIILPDSNILVNVKYSAIDFDLFKLWKIEDTKITSQQSQKVVATQLRDTITGELLNSTANGASSTITTANTTSASSITAANDDSKIVIISNYSPKYKLVFIKYLDRVNLNSNQNIRYYGFVPQSKSDVLHSYCSIVDNQYLSYHGSKLKLPNSILVSNNITDKSKLNIQNETRSIQKLFTTGIETNNFTNLNFDLSVIFNIAAATTATIANGTTTSIANGAASTILSNCEEIDLNNSILSVSSGFVNLAGKSADEIKKAFVGQRGIIILSKFRDNISTILYLNSTANNIYITENIIDNLLLIMNYDRYNLNLWSSQ